MLSVMNGATQDKQLRIIEIPLQVVSLAIQYASILNSNISHKLCEGPSMESSKSEKLIHQTLATNPGL